MTEPRKLYRDTQNAVLAGVAAGTAEYLNVDITVARVVWVVGLVVTGLLPLGVVYAAMWLLVPPKPALAPAAAAPVQQS